MATCRCEPSPRRLTPREGFTRCRTAGSGVIGCRADVGEAEALAGGLVITPPKTRSSKNWVAVSPRVAAALHHRARSGTPTHNNPREPFRRLVFCRPDGRPLRPSTECFVKTIPSWPPCLLSDVACLRRLYRTGPEESRPVARGVTDRSGTLAA